jgi:hypothetical protein
LHGVFDLQNAKPRLEGGACGTGAERGNLIYGFFDADLASGITQNETDEVEDRNRSLTESEACWGSHPSRLSIILPPILTFSLAVSRRPGLLNVYLSNIDPGEIFEKEFSSVPAEDTTATQRPNSTELRASHDVLLEVRGDLAYGFPPVEKIVPLHMSE